MPDSTSVQSFLGKRDRSLAENLVAWLLLPFSLTYWLIMEYRRFFYRMGIFKSVRLPLPVISVGGLTIGGSGKTPVVIYIADYLTSLGKKVLILTRGYGGETKAITVIRPTEETPMDRLSDEVRLMANRLSATIAVGADRVAAFEQAYQPNDYNVVILDDGFQHLKIKRDLDIVVLDATAPYGSGYVLPSGNLRESKSSLGRANAILLTRTSQAVQADTTVTGLQAERAPLPVFPSDYVLDRISDVHTGDEIVMGALAGKPVHAFSAIANPESFFSMIEKQGAEIRCTREFQDHHIYTQVDVNELVEEARAKKCAVFLVTEKDAVKLHALDFGEFQVFSYRIRLQITRDEDTLHSLITGVVNEST